MLTIDEKEYNLNALIHFEMLREILIKLSRNQTELITEVELMKKSNQQRDKKIIELEESLKESNNKLSEVLNQGDVEEKKQDINNTEIIKTDESINKNYNQTKDKPEIKKSTENKILLKNIKECHSRIDKLELELTQLIMKENGNIKKSLKNHDLDNQSNFKMIDTKFNEIDEKLIDYNKKVEDCIVKCTTIDIINVIKDNGSDTIEGAKILFKTLEEKCFKKIDLIESRYKKDSLNLSKLKKNIDNFMPTLDKVNREIEDIKESEEQLKQEIYNKKKVFSEKNEKLNNELLEEKFEEILKQINELKEENENNIKAKIKDIEEKINGDGTSSLFKLGLVNNNGIDEEKIQQLDKKINDVRKKTHDLENTFKILLNEEIEILKNDVKELKFKIDKKIAKEDLKELYNLHLSDLDDINDLKDQTTLMKDEIKKITKDIQNLGSKTESIHGNLLMIQNSPIGGTRSSVIDFTKYIDQQRLSDTLRPLLKEIESLYKEIEAFHRELNDLEKLTKGFEKIDRINRLEEDLLSKINELKLYSSRKYADKIEINKTIKTIETQIKETLNEKKKFDGDGWLMAKQPIKCFNCASCEANIKNMNPTQEYIPWNKYPQGERMYRMGQGFSHMLQMMTSEFIKTFGESDNNSFININYNSENNDLLKNSTNMLFNSNDKTFSSLQINHRDNYKFKEDAFSFCRSGSKIRLPKMKKIKPIKDKLNESIPISDDEKDNNAESAEKMDNIITESPKIMKIVKKRQNPNNNSGLSPKNNSSIGLNRNFIKIKEKLNKKIGNQ